HGNGRAEDRSCDDACQARICVDGPADLDGSQRGRYVNLTPHPLMPPFIQRSVFDPGRHQPYGVDPHRGTARTEMDASLTNQNLHPTSLATPTGAVTVWAPISFAPSAPGPRNSYLKPPREGESPWQAEC